MNHSSKVGISFGTTSGIITTLGLMVGLNASTSLKEVVIGGILTIAIADAFSDSLGIHISEEAENKHSPREIWLSTITTFLAKFVVALTFVVPVTLLPLGTAVIANIIWGFALLTTFSYLLAIRQNRSPFSVVIEHLLIAFLVIVTTNFAGDLIAKKFGR